VAEALAGAFAIGDDPGDTTMSEVPVERLKTLLVETVNALHDRAGQERPEIVTREMEAPGHIAVAFSWTSRTFGKRVAQTAFDIVAGHIDGLDARLEALRECAAAAPTADDCPAMLADEHRTIPIIGITGTNGKTTTTRLISSILMAAGRRVGWTSSAGVVVQGEMVLEGDFTGPAGAARVFEEPDLDIAVLETARGGILLRGLGYESNDVSVVTNISADHLGLHGVHTVEELARVKQVVASVTKPDGFVVLNAGDPLVLAMRERVLGRVFLITRTDDNQAVIEHRAAGGWALWVADGIVHFGHDDSDEVLTDLNDIPITLGGRATHMVENALCAAAATLAIGLGLDRVRTGLAAFRNEPGQNRGRLNLFAVGESTFVIDFAHNVAGLSHLLGLGRKLAEPGGRLIAAVGTAGDRPDDAIQELGRLAGKQADVVILKDTHKYLRGREPGDILRLLESGLRETTDQAPLTSDTEYEAFEQARTLAQPGDVVVIMCIEDVDRILDEMTRIGTPIV
jgi:cyanophycin synthetase